MYISLKMYVLLRHFSKKDDTRNPSESEANEKIRSAESSTAKQNLAKPRLT